MAKRSAINPKTPVPRGSEPDSPKWQQRKSSQTRTAMMDATIDCLERHGYAQTTMQLIADVADISRGAMTHHYSSKQELISAVIDYLFHRRMAIFNERIGSLTEKQRVDENLGIEQAWEGYFTREYKAYLELSVAARTDDELRDIFLPKAQHYERIWRKASTRIFKEWKGKPELLEHASDFVEATLEGLVLNRPIWDDPDREAVLRALLAMVIRKLREGELELPPKAVARKFRGPQNGTGK